MLYIIIICCNLELEENDNVLSLHIIHILKFKFMLLSTDISIIDLITFHIHRY